MMERCVIVEDKESGELGTGDLREQDGRCDERDTMAEFAGSGRNVVPISH